MKKRITALLLLLTLSVTSLFACTSADKSESASDKTAKTSKSTSTKKQELTPVTLNEVAHSIFYAPMYVAIEKGYFANEGIDLSLVTGFGADKTMTAVLSGTADIGFMGSEASIYTYNEGANDYVVNFAQLTQRAGNFLVAREDIKDFKWEDLKGKKVIGGRKGGMPEMVFEYILNQNHIDPATDLTIDQNIDFGSTAAAFAEDKSDYDFTVEFENRVRDTLSPLLERTAAMFRTLLSLQRRVTSTNIRKSSRDSPMHCKKVWTTWHPTHRKTLPRQSLLSSKRPHWIRSQPSFPAIMSRIHGKKI